MRGGPFYGKDKTDEAIRFVTSAQAPPFARVQYMLLLKDGSPPKIAAPVVMRMLAGSAVCFVCQ